MPLGNGLYVNYPGEASLCEYIDGVPVRKLFVGKIPNKISEKTIYAKFNKFGDVASVVYKIQKRKSRSTSYNKNVHNINFAFITYKNPESATKILRGPKMYFYNQELKIVAADSWHQPLVNPDGTVLFNSSLWLKHADNNVEFVEQPEETDTLCTNVEGIEDLSMEWTDNSFINKLNDDCLEVIFAKLNLESQVIASQVCKQWDAIISNMLQKMEIFNLRLEYFNDVKISFQSFENVLKKVGPYLKTFFDNNVEFYKSSSFQSSIIYFVATYCPNLESLVLLSSKIRPRSFTYLAMMCPYLTKLTLLDCENIDFELCQFFNSRNCKLKELKIMNCHIPGQCFKSFPITLESLKLDSCYPSADKLFIKGLQKLKNSLIRLEIRNSATVECSSLNLHSISALHGLKYLSFTHIFHESSVYKINIDIKFSKLESLNLECNGNMIEFLIMDVLKSCKELKFLNMTGLNVTESVAKCITELESLEELVISKPLKIVKKGSCTIIDDVIEKICTPSTSLNLKKIECQNWDDLSDASVVSLLKRFKELSYLDLSCCQNITNKLLVSALDIVKGRTDNIPLHIDITGTNINSNSSLINHQLLKINSKQEADKNKTTNANITNEDINKILNEYSLKKMKELNLKLISFGNPNTTFDVSFDNLGGNPEDFEFYFMNLHFGNYLDLDDAIDFEEEDDDISIEDDFDDDFEDDFEDLSDFEF